jgi:hypothetical protein
MDGHLWRASQVPSRFLSRPRDVGIRDHGSQVAVERPATVGQASSSPTARPGILVTALTPMEELALPPDNR